MSRFLSQTIRMRTIWHLRSFAHVALALLAIQFILPASAEDFSAGSMTIQDPWARPTPPNAKTGAGYFRVTNNGAAADQLLSASSRIASHVEIHRQILDGTVMRMRRVDSINIAPGQTLSFEPGGYHVMFIGLTQPLVEGDAFPMSIIFQDAGLAEVSVKVRAPAQ